MCGVVERRVSLRHATSRHAVPQARGTSLVEVVMFILIVSIAVTSIVNLLAISAQRSADPVVVRQALAVAESMLQEISAQPTSIKDPDDPNGPDEAIGPESGEVRTSALTPFDHVDDYDGLVVNGVQQVDGSFVPGLAGYRTEVSVSHDSFDNIPSNDVFLIRVTVTGPGGTPVSLTGVRTRHTR